MKIVIAAIGTKLPHWADLAIDAYLKRFPLGNYALKIKSIAAQKRSKSSQVSGLVNKESSALLDAVPKGYRIIVLDVGGKSLSSKQLAEQLKNNEQQGEHLAILIGGPDGFNDQLRQKAQARWSLSKLTMPHPLARVLVVETLYRSISMLYHHPYHRIGE